MATKLFYRYTREVFWGDMDAMQHLNNCVYFKYMEEARIASLRHEGYSISEGNCTYVVVQIGCDFIKEVVYPETLHLDCSVAQVGRSSFELVYDFISSSNGLVVAKGVSTLVWIDAQRRKSAPLPKDLKDRLVSFI